MTASNTALPPNRRRARRRDSTPSGSRVVPSERRRTGAVALAESEPAVAATARRRHGSPLFARRSHIAMTILVCGVAATTAVAGIFPSRRATISAACGCGGRRLDSSTAFCHGLMSTPSPRFSASHRHSKFRLRAESLPNSGGDGLSMAAGNVSPPTSAVPVAGSLTAAAAVLLSLLLGAVVKLTPPGSWRYFLAGGICASTSHAITTPIDVVKTRQQVDPLLQEKSMWGATLAIVKQGGPFALLAGLGPTALGYLIEGAVKFGIYEVTKPTTKRFVSSLATFLSFPMLDCTLSSLVLCGCTAGFFASIMLCPMEALRIRMVSDAEFGGKHWIDAGSTMLEKEGIRGVYKGIAPMMFKQVPYTITKNASFDMLTMIVYRFLTESGRAITGNVRFVVPLLSAMTAAVLSCISSHPGDILLSLVNAHEGEKQTSDFAKEIWRGEKGWRGFFVGIKPRFLHVLLIVTVQLLIYDFVKSLVGVAATGMG